MFPGKEIVYNQYQDWILGILVINILFLIYAYYTKPLFFKRLADSLVNINATNKLLNEKNSLTNRLSGSLNFVFSINAGLILFLMIQEQGYEFPVRMFPLQLLTLIFSVIVLVYFRLFIYYIVGWITNQLDTQQEYISYWMMLNKSFGILLIPGILCILYLPLPDKSIIFNIYLVALVLLYLAKLFRGIQISVRNKLSLFSIILYLCALEIMPVAMLIKYLMSM